MAWDGTLQSTALLSTEAALADNIISTASAEVDNRSNLDTIGFIELSAHTWSSAPDDDFPTIDVYIDAAPDGINFSTAPLTGGANQDQAAIVSIPVTKLTSTQRVFSKPFALPNAKLKFYFDNQTGQELGANYVCKLFSASI